MNPQDYQQDTERLDAAKSCAALIVMAKAPRVGEVKTRLMPALTPRQAAGFAACCVQDVVRTAQSVAPVNVAYAPSDGLNDLAALLPADVTWIVQRGANLGERMSAAFLDAFRQGCGPLVMIGTDSPTLPPKILVAALHALTDASPHARPFDVVLGPAEDGGYYLIGLRRPEPALFDHVEWSTPRAYAQTEANALRLGLTVHRLPVWYDVDLPDDLHRLRAELLALPHPEARAPQVYRWFRDNAFLFR